MDKIPPILIEHDGPITRSALRRSLANPAINSSSQRINSSPSTSSTDFQLEGEISKDIENQINLLVSDTKYIIPNTFKQVLISQQKNQWLKACQAELKAMKDLNVYQVINKSSLKGTPVIRGRWVFNVKKEADNSERFKARLVAKGFTQEIGQNYLETFSPVISMDSIRFLLSLCANKGWFINQMDAKNAFLNGKLKYKIYFDPPEGCNVDKNKVWLLKKALYGLKNAPLIFYQTFSRVLIDAGFEASRLDPCILYNNRLKVYIAMYVDDLLLISETVKGIEATKKILEQKFEMKDMGTPKIFLGVTISRKGRYDIKLSMKDTIERIQNNFQIVVAKRKYQTPIEKGFLAENENSRRLMNEEHSKYRQVIGSLLYIANTVRLDIAYPVSLLSRYLVTPRECHLKAAYRILHYLIQTKYDGLRYSNEKKLKLNSKDYRLLDTNKKAIIHDYPNQGKYLITTVTDASFANETDRHSQHGHITYMNNNIISWSSKRQSIVALSTAEAEYIGMTEAMKANIHFNGIMKELRLDVTYGKICSDNMAALQLGSHKIHHQRTKHIDIRYHFMREKVLNREIKLDYINTKYNVADCLTKLVDTNTSKRLGELIFPK